MLELIKKIFGTKTQRDIRKITPILSSINKEYATMQSLSNDELRQASTKIKDSIKTSLAALDSEIVAVKQKINETQDDIVAIHKYEEQIESLTKANNGQIEITLNEHLPTAFAIIKETCRRFATLTNIKVTAKDFDLSLSKTRDYVSIEDDIAIWKNSWEVLGTKITWDMIPYDVQILGGITLHQGKIAEMATGEGKTLISLFPIFLNALTDLNVHLVTVNSYLAQRDSQWMRPILEFHGLTVDCIDIHHSHSKERRNAYLANVVYGTNNEFGFDYLRDNMASEYDEVVQRSLHYAIVDEVDSVLIDDARTPLIISGPVQEDSPEEFSFLQPVIESIVREQKDLIKNHLQNAKRLITEQKPEGDLDLFRAYRGLPKYKPLIKYLSEQGIKKILTKMEHYYLQDNSRMMPEADEPLLFTIEERNNSVELTQKGIDFISKLNNDATFFTLPDLPLLLADIENENGLTTQERLEKIGNIKIDYKNKSKRLHTIKQLLKAHTLFEIDVDYIKKNNKIYIVDEQTGRILEGRRYSDGLHQALEAKENVKIQKASQTYATITLQNYFRMYHKLAGMTGTASTEAAEFWDIYKLDVVEIPTNKPITREDREDFVYKTTREKFNAVITEILSLTSQNRPVLVGTTSVEISELVSRMLTLKKVKHKVLNAKYHELEAEIVAQAGVAGSVTIATNMAGRGTDIKLTPEAKLAGGLAIIGTERHESRRVDRQLRGRSGRQGDQGSSQFFISLEDQLMRIFGSDRIITLMDKIGLEEGEVVQHSMVTKSITTAQKKVEQGNFATRKRLLEYDNVMNSQRSIIYKKRNRALKGSLNNIEIDLKSMIYETLTKIIDSASKEGSQDLIMAKATKIFDCELQWPVEAAQNKNQINMLTTQTYFKIIDLYQTKKETMGKTIKDIVTANPYEKHDHMITFLTNHNLSVNIPIFYEKTDFDENIRLAINKFEKNILLKTIDDCWRQHLHAMDDLKQTVQNVVYEKRDPILVYKIESYDLFQNFIDDVYSKILEDLFHATIVNPANNTTPINLPPADIETLMMKLKEIFREEETNEQSLNNSINDSYLLKHNFNRNDKVSVIYNDGTEKIDIKFKSIEEDLKTKRCRILTNTQKEPLSENNLNNETL